MFRTFALGTIAVWLGIVWPCAEVLGQGAPVPQKTTPSTTSWQAVPTLPTQLPIPQQPSPNGVPTLPPPAPPPSANGFPGMNAAPPPNSFPAQDPLAPGFPLMDPAEDFLVPNPLRQPARPRAGFFGTVELGLVAPNVSGSLIGPVTGGINRTIGLPYAELDWTGSPRLELGYHFGEDSGSFLAAYRSVVSEGTATVSPFDSKGPGFLETRLNMNLIDLGYATPAWAIDPLWDLRLDGGVRIAAIYSDSQITGMAISQSASNNFVGAGPRIGVNLHRHLDRAHGLSLFGRLDTGVIIGGDTQSFEEIRTFPGGTRIGGASRMSETQAAPMLGLQLGMSYQPKDSVDWFRFSFGYQYEQWWNVGSAGDSQGDVSFQGLFFRGEFNF
jgi:hypothetical protein